MALQILSDLHLEYPKAYDIYEVVPKAPYLALLGDIGNVVKHKDDFTAFLTKQLMQFKAVLFVSGNHEPYESTWPETLKVLRTFEEDVRKNPAIGAFVLLDRGFFKVPESNVTILGCSLFSNIPPEKKLYLRDGLQDFYQTREWDVYAHNEAHMRDLSWLNAEIDKHDAKIIILTHWSPSTDPRSTDAKHSKSPISSGFSTDLSNQHCFQSDKVKVWAFGHTHYNCDLTVEREGISGPLRLLANQRGYYQQQALGFDEEKVVEL